VRGPGAAAGANADLPASWSTSRSRLLCSWPRAAHYSGGDIESAASFVCR